MLYNLTLINNNILSIFRLMKIIFMKYMNNTDDSQQKINILNSNKDNYINHQQYIL